MTRALPAIGRATREAITDDGGERWGLGPADARVAVRLLALGKEGVGGFVEGGEEAGGSWLRRASGEPTLAAWLRDHPGPVPWREAVTMIAALAEAAAACERAALFPGPIEPDEVTVTDGRIVLRADSLVAALVGGGEGSSPATASGSSKWMAPAQADGAPADSASNRYAIGLMLYRLLAGEHPFATVGLRKGMSDQAGRGAPPMTAEVAAELPVGLQSLTLRMLEPELGRRPRNASSIARQLNEFLAAGAPSPVPVPVPVPVPDRGLRTSASTSTSTSASTSASTSTSTTTTTTGGWIGRLAFGAPLVLGLVAVIAIVGAGKATAKRAVGVSAQDKPLGKATALSDCASCHPRQGAEWSRSVMAHATGSPLYQSLEMLIEEQVGRQDDCPNGAGVLRSAGAGPCVNQRTGIAVTGSGGELWCVNCHAPGQNIARSLPAWNATSFDASSRRPLRDLLPAAAQEGISCAFCHQVTGPARPGGSYEGNPAWVSSETGARFSMRPEDERGLFGIANSGYLIDLRALIGGGEQVAGGAHRASTAAQRAYLRSSEFCGSCHDVRLFGTDAIEGVRRGEHFKRLRNAYSEWVSWADDERRAGRAPASCQDCHMSLYPGVCVPAPGEAPGTDLAARACPPGTRFADVPPGRYPTGHAAAGSEAGPLHGHSFTGVDLPLDPAFDASAIDDATLDVDGLPRGTRQRRDLLLARTFRLAIEGARRGDGRLELPIVVENVGAGHRVPAGFSQEREFWLHVRVTDARGAVVYESGRVDRATDDLRDKQMLRVNTSDTFTDRRGRPLGLFGADVADGPDAPLWTADAGGGRDTSGASDTFRGRGLVNFQNGFMRCVSCIGQIDASGRCQALPGQERARADRFVDGDYDLDTGECRSNLRGANAFVEIYFPVGALDASRGVVRGPDAIIDTRSLPPRRPQRFVHELEVPASSGALTVEVRLRFRAFPPFLIRAFAEYEREQARLGRRPSGPLVDGRALARLDIVDVAETRVVVP